jgi:hypothetical protein
VARLSDHENRLLWIFGSSRSGSTWLLRMLSDFDGVVPVDDPHLGHHLGVWRPIPLAWSISEEPAPELTTLLELKAEEPGYFFSERHRDSWWEPLRSLICARFEAQAGEALEDPSTARAYIVKEPGSHVAPFLCELFPRSKLVFLLRDGRDVVDSWLDAYRDGSWAIRGGAFPVTPEGRVTLIRWLSSVWAYRTKAVLRAFESRRPEDRLLVRYEEMRERPGQTLREIGALLGLDTARSGEIADGHAFERLPETSRGPLKETRLASPGSWQEHLSDEEQQAMHEVLGGVLAEVGYLEDERALALGTA